MFSVRLSQILKVIRFFQTTPVNNARDYWIYRLFNNNNKSLNQCVTYVQISRTQIICENNSPAQNLLFWTRDQLVSSTWLLFTQQCTITRRRWVQVNCILTEPTKKLRKDKKRRQEIDVNRSNYLDKMKKPYSFNQKKNI